jgi:hypothetical protein
VVGVVVLVGDRLRNELRDSSTESGAGAGVSPFAGRGAIATVRHIWDTLRPTY